MSRLWRGAVLTMTPLILVACDSQGSLHPLIDDLEENRAIWGSLAIDSYSYVVERQCFCPVEARGPVEVEVEHGVATRRTYPATGDTVPEAHVDLFPTVTGLFDFIADAVDANAATIRVTWDDDTGVPIEVWIDFLENAVDEEVGFAVRALPAVAGG